LGVMAISASAEGVTAGAATPIAGPAFVAGAVQAGVGALQTTVGAWGLYNFSQLSPLQQPPAQETQEHHSDPKFMGGEPDQPTTTMPTHEHQDLHQDLNAFLKEQTDGVGSDMMPRRGNSGQDIRETFTRQQRIDAVGEFYRNNQDQYPDAARDFFKQHPEQAK